MTNWKEEAKQLLASKAAAAKQKEAEDFSMPPDLFESPSRRRPSVDYQNAVNSNKAGTVDDGEFVDYGYYDEMNYEGREAESSFTQKTTSSHSQPHTTEAGTIISHTDLYRSPDESMVYDESGKPTNSEVAEIMRRRKEEILAKRKAAKDAAAALVGTLEKEKQSTFDDKPPKNSEISSIQQQQASDSLNLNTANNNQRLSAADLEKLKAKRLELLQKKAEKLKQLPTLNKK